MEVNKPLPLISIIVPIYNIAEYASECIQSLINQTYKNIEIILVDDGSTDHSPAICDEFAEQDERIKVIHKRNGVILECDSGYKVEAKKLIIACGYESQKYLPKKII